MPLPYPVLSCSHLAKPTQRRQSLAAVHRCHRQASRLFGATTADSNLRGEFAVLLSFSPCCSHREPRPETPFGEAPGRSGHGATIFSLYSDRRAPSLSPLLLFSAVQFRSDGRDCMIPFWLGKFAKESLEFLNIEPIGHSLDLISSIQL